MARNVVKFGLESRTGCAGPDWNDEEDDTFLTVDLASAKDGSSARSSLDTLPAVPHAYWPDNPSLEPRLLSLELEDLGRSCGEEAVEGLDLSACASYRSRNVATERFNVTAGACAVPVC